VMAERDTLVAPRTADAARWLGPAPGPKASAAIGGEARPASSPAAETNTKAKVGPPAAKNAGPKRRRIKVEVGEPHETEGATLLAQSFVLEHPREAVWNVMADLNAVAACMPGLSVEGPFEGGRVTGRMEVRLGPIKASFAGEGRVESFAAEYRQIITGSGGDRNSGSSASGRVTYALRPETIAGGEATRVDVEMSYALTGPLAQFGRSGLVRDLVSRIGEAFAQNLDARLTAPEGAVIAPAKLGVFSLVFGTLIARLFGKRSG
jgi:aerobic carbon-monoxide dehydrogenase small subunit